MKALSFAGSSLVAKSAAPKIAKSEAIEDLGDDLAKYTKAWDEVKAAK